MTHSLILKNFSRTNLQANINLMRFGVSSFFRMKAQTLVDSLSELMVDATLGTIQCLEEIVSKCLT